MIEQNLKDKSTYKSLAWRNLSARWNFVAGLWSDSFQIQTQGTEFLHQFKREPDEKYKFRLKNSVFENDFRGTIEGLAGQVFRKDPTPTNIHAEILSLFQDIDGCGNSFIAYNQTGFEYFLRDGNVAIFVDAPPLSGAAEAKVAEGETPTLADRQFDRPNWVLIQASQIINYKFEKEGSREILSQVTIEEKGIESDGTFGEKEVIRHRILRRGSFEVLQYNEQTKEFVVDETIPQGATGLAEIPLFPVADFNNPPPFMTLAMLNNLLYNKTSDFDDVMHIACTPRWIEKYDSVEDAKEAANLETASAAVGKKIFGQSADAFYREITGAGLSLAKERCQDIEKRMEKFGFGMFMPSEIAPRTATEIEDTAGRRESKLARLTRQWQNAVEKAMYATAEYINAIKGKNTINLDEAEKGKMKLVIDYERLTFSIEQLRAFDLLVDKGRLSNKTFLEKLAVITEIDAEDELERLAEERPLEPKNEQPKD